MNTFRIKPGKLSGSITVPPSKSHTLRALVFALMAQGKSIIRNYLNSTDTIAMISAIEQFGAKVSVFPDRIEVIGGRDKEPNCTVDAKNSGIVLRFMAALAALHSNDTNFVGDFNRPIVPLFSALEQLGAKVENFKVRGPIKYCEATLLGEDSQPVSALLIALSFLKQKTILQVKNPGEKPWIDLTLHWLKKLGTQVVHKNYEYYEITGPAEYEGFDYTVPGDFSSAAYPIAAAVLTQSELEIPNLDFDDVQGDKKFIDILIEMGACIEKKQNHLIISPSPLKGINIDINDCIDMITILPVVACFAVGKTEIYNAEIARRKESDRITAIVQELRKMGAVIEEKQDGMMITPSKLRGACLQSHNDHRMTLALSVAAFNAEGETIIEGVECISKTYPTFMKDFQELGAVIC